MLSIIVPCFNQHDMTNECIYAILENTSDCEIIIIDNGSIPPYKPPFSGFTPITIIRNEENKGYPAAINQGIKKAKGDIIILLNNDVIVTPQWAERLVSYIEDGFAIVAPLTNYCAGAQQITLPVYENIDGLYKQAEILAEANSGMIQEVNFVIGFCMAFKKTLYDEIGEFDESLWPCSGEEIDFCLKTRKKGYNIGVAHDVYVHHFGSITFKEMEKAGQVDYIKTCKRNDAHLAKRWGSNFWYKQAIEEDVENAIING